MEYFCNYIIDIIIILLFLHYPKQQKVQDVYIILNMAYKLITLFKFVRQLL